MRDVWMAWCRAPGHDPGMSPPAKLEHLDAGALRRRLIEQDRELPRTEIHHEPHSTTCACGCQMQRIGEDVAEKRDYTPGTFSVERHIRGKWVCAPCKTLVQASVSADVIDKSLSSATGRCPS